MYFIERAESGRAGWPVLAVHTKEKAIQIASISEYMVGLHCGISGLTTYTSKRIMEESERKVPNAMATQKISLSFHASGCSDGFTRSFEMVMTVPSLRSARRIIGSVGKYLQMTEVVNKAGLHA